MSEDDKRELKIILLCIAGLLVIIYLVPKIVVAVGGFFGIKYKSNAFPLLFAALFMYMWGQVCLKLKNGGEEDEEEKQEDQEG